MNFETVKLLHTSDAVHDYVEDLWKTDIFRFLHKRGRPGQFVFDIVDQFAKLPRFFFEMTDKKLEHAHFSTWWGGIPYREYDNPYIHDLYLIHEFAHAGTMVYLPDMNYENFLREMTDNELYASVVSEIQVYFEIPELRELSFNHPIYADRFLQDKDFMRRYQYDKRSAFREMKVRRRNTMMNSNADNVTDFWIHRFYNQNAAWGACWAHNFNKVEKAMAFLRDKSLNATDAQRADALTVFIHWLENQSTNNIPFLREAEAFAGIYWGNRGHYDDQINK